MLRAAFAALLAPAQTALAVLMRPFSSLAWPPAHLWPD